MPTFGREEYSSTRAGLVWEKCERTKASAALWPIRVLWVEG